MTKFTYTQTDTKLFYGFYESIWREANSYDSDYIAPDNCYLDIKDSTKWSIEASKQATDVLFNNVDDSLNIINSYTFKELKSPSYYNFTTDKLVIDVDINILALFRYCLKTNKDSFVAYLQENHASRDGYISFIDIDIDSFVKNNNNQTVLDIMLDFYLVDNLDESNFEDDTYYAASEILSKFLYLFDSSDNCFYNYDVDDTTWTFIKLEKVK